jgi:hypothetical protein
MRIVRTPLVWLVAAVATAAAVIVLTRGDDGGDGSPQPSQPTTRSQPTPRSSPAQHATAPSRQAPKTRDGGERADRSGGAAVHRAVHRAVASSPAPSLDPGQREVVRVVHSYVAALNAHDGARACALFVSGALSSVKFPRERGDCAASLGASVGYRDPRGFPVYDRSRVARIRSVVIQGTQARVTATIVTHFADNREPSIEDDVIYLRDEGGRWLIVKPSATLYRAIGAGNIPPQVLAPP